MSFLVSSDDFLSNVCQYLPVEDVYLTDSDMLISHSGLSQHIDLLPYNIALQAMMQFPEYALGFKRFLNVVQRKLEIHSDLLDKSTLEANKQNQLIMILAMQYYFV